MNADFSRSKHKLKAFSHAIYYPLLRSDTLYIIKCLAQPCNVQPKALTKTNPTALGTIHNQATIGGP